jgi:transcriptional regulator with GAF, ATPase, and Fis domain
VDSIPPEETQLQLAAAASSYRSFPSLRWADEAGAHVVVLDRRMVVGSSEHAHVRVLDRSISRLHAELEPRDDGVWVRDLESRNHTFVNGVRVTLGCAPDGAVVQAGGVPIHVDFTSAEARAVTAWRFGAFGRLVGATQPMRELFAQLSRIAPSEGPVLIRGETGTGKELVARAIHEASARARAPFIVVDCAALPETLLEAELYGHTKGAFTGAVTARPGVFEAAEGGTVFLDEIGELPISLQPKLLRVLESKTIRRLGESVHRPVDVRFVAATHRDLLGMVNARTFREDLYFRLSVLPVYVPPLRERLADIPLLARHLLSPRKHAALTPAIEEALMSMPWRGNVRELRNFMERALALGFEEALGMHRAEERPPRDPSSSVSAEVAAPASAAPSSGRRAELPSFVDVVEGVPGAEADVERPLDPKIYDLVYKDFREQWIDHGEREYIRRRLSRLGHNVSAVAREVELARAYIYRLLKKHDL